MKKKDIQGAKSLIWLAKSQLTDYANSRFRGKKLKLTDIDKMVASVDRKLLEALRKLG